MKRYWWFPFLLAAVGWLLLWAVVLLASCGSPPPPRAADVVALSDGHYSLYAYVDPKARVGACAGVEKVYAFELDLRDGQFNSPVPETGCVNTYAAPDLITIECRAFGAVLTADGTHTGTNAYAVGVADLVGLQGCRGPLGVRVTARRLGP